MMLAFLRNNQARIVDALYERIHQTTQAEAHFVPNELRDNIARGATAFLTTLEDNDPTAIEHFITDLIAPRTVEEFPLAVLHRTFTVFGEMLLPLLRECYGDDTGRILDDLQSLHLLIAAILQKLVEQYETRSKVLVRRQQEQLRAYSQQLQEGHPLPYHTVSQSTPLLSLPHSRHSLDTMAYHGVSPRLQ